MERDRFMVDTAHSAARVNNQFHGVYLSRAAQDAASGTVDEQAVDERSDRRQLAGDLLAQ